MTPIQHLSFYLSYCRAEHAIMEVLPDYIRDGYIFAKAVRIADIASDGINLKQLDVVEDIRTDDFLTSYILKNTLFNILKTPVTANVAQCKYAWTEAIYTELVKSLLDRYISAWHETESLLYCELGLGDRACCQKRAIMLALAQKIKTWLQENMEELHRHCVHYQVKKFIGKI